MKGRTIKIILRRLLPILISANGRRERERDREREREREIIYQTFLNQLNAEQRR